jgi:hypothetical protein
MSISGRRTVPRTGRVPTEASASTVDNPPIARYVAASALPVTARSGSRGAAGLHRPDQVTRRDISVIIS